MYQPTNYLYFFVEKKGLIDPLEIRYNLIILHNTLSISPKHARESFLLFHYR
jgi:hypothetical protein